MNVIGNHPHRGLKSQDWKCEKFDLSRNQTCRKINIHPVKNTDEFQDTDFSSSWRRSKKKKEKEKKTKVSATKRSSRRESINVNFARPLILLFRREKIGTRLRPV